MKVTKILIAETSPIISSGLSSFFNDMNQIAVASIVDNIDDLQDKIIMYNPDVLIQASGIIPGSPASSRNEGHDPHNQKGS